MKREEKIKQTLEDDKCFKISETERYIYYTCKGVTGHIYDIIYYKGLDKWKCSCNNLRKSDCYHIAICQELFKKKLLEKEQSI